MRIINIHKNLYAYIKKIIQAKTSRQDKIRGFKALLIIYIKEMLKTFILMFRFVDPRYLIELYKKYKQDKIKREFNRALKFLKRIQYIQKKNGMSRREQRQFWNDFIKNTMVREDSFNKLEKDLK